MLTREEAKSVLECRWRLQQVYTDLVIWAVISLIASPIGILTVTEPNSAGFGAWIFIVCLYGIPFGAMTLYSYWQYWRIRKHFHSFRQYRVRLDRPSTSWMYRGAIYYTVSFQTEAGKHVTVDTKALWSSRGIHPIPLEEYNNKEVTVLYDPEGEEVFVVGLAK